MDNTVVEKPVKIKKTAPDLLEQYYHESSRVWKVIKEKSHKQKQIQEN